MFLAVTFMCFANNECNFIYDRYQTTIEQCEKRNESVARLMEANPKVVTYRTVCIPVPKANTKVIA
jgi:hypothetical protein